jgi:hypothetical protein
LAARVAAQHVRDSGGLAVERVDHRQRDRDLLACGGRERQLPQPGAVTGREQPSLLLVLILAALNVLIAAWSCSLTRRRAATFFARLGLGPCAHVQESSVQAVASNARTSTRYIVEGRD